MNTSLFSPLDIGKVRFKNRTVMAPMVLNCAGEEGSVTPAFEDFYAARARAGVGCIVLGATFVHNDGRGFGRQLGIDRDELLPGLTGLASTLRQHTRLAVQLSFKSVGRPPEVFTRAQISAYRQAFVEAAVRARKAGFDAVELHACHDYWLNYFLSPFFNHRSDEYGGSLDNRFRLLAETTQEVLSAVGGDILVGVRLSMTDFTEAGLGLDETLEIGRRLEALGVDYLSASAGIGLTQFRMSPPSDVPRGRLLVYGRALQQTVSIPVIGVGRLDRPEAFREAVEGGHVAMAAAARAFISDPEFALKIEQKREGEIRPCLACNYCLTCLHQGKALRCTVNPYVGRDLLEPKPLAKPVRVIVLGGGPAGLSAAAAAAKRGARVHLIDRRPVPGGTLLIADRPPFKEPIADFARYLEAQALSAGVTLEMGREFTPALLAEHHPDEVIVASGALPWAPSCLCMSDGGMIAAEEILQCGEVRPGRYLVVGGGLVGLETAEYLACRGCEVTVVEMLDQVGAGLGPLRLKLMLDRMVKAGINLLTRTKVIAVEDRSLRVETAGRQYSLGPCEAVVVAAGYRGNPIPEAAFGKAIKVQVIGDARKARSIVEAVGEGLDAALNIGK